MASTHYHFFIVNPSKKCLLGSSLKRQTCLHSCAVQLAFVEEGDLSSADAKEFFAALGSADPTAVVIPPAESDDCVDSGGAFATPRLFQVCFNSSCLASLSLICWFCWS